MGRRGGAIRAAVVAHGLGAGEVRRWLTVPPRRGPATTEEPSRVLGVDQSEACLAAAGRGAADPRFATAIGRATGLPAADGEFDRVVAALVLNFVPRPADAVAEMRRATRAGGLVGGYVWDYAEGMELIRLFWAAATDVDPAAAELDEGRRFPLCRPGPLRALFEAAGLVGVEVAPIEVPTVFADFDDLWGPFLGGQGPAPVYCTALPEVRRLALRVAADSSRAGVHHRRRGQEPAARPPSYSSPPSDLSRPSGAPPHAAPKLAAVRLVAGIWRDQWHLSRQIAMTSGIVASSGIVCGVGRRAGGGTPCAPPASTAPDGTQGNPRPARIHEPSRGHTDFRHHTRVRTHVPCLKLSANTTIRAPTPHAVCNHHRSPPPPPAPATTGYHHRLPPPPPPPSAPATTGSTAGSQLDGPPDAP